MNIGHAIKTLRWKVLMNQKEFASSVGITQTYLSLIERGHKKPSLKVLQQIADILNMPLPLMLWFGIEREDVDLEQYAYDALKTSIDTLINEWYNTEILIKHEARKRTILNELSQKQNYAKSNK